LVDNEGWFDLLEEGIADGCSDVKVTLSNGRSVGSMDSSKVGRDEGSNEGARLDSVGVYDGSNEGINEDSFMDGSDDISSEG